MTLVVFVFFTLLVSIKGSYALCCNYGTSDQYPGQSCAEILIIAPGCKDLSGYYWVERANGSAAQVYCNMDFYALGGGWERVASFDASVDTSCPGTNMGVYQIGSLRLCTNNNGSSNITSATYYPVQKTYSQVRGLMTAYTSGQGYSFRLAGNFLNYNLNQVYMDGISLGIVDSSGFTKHIHSDVIGYQLSEQDYKSCYSTAQLFALHHHVIGKDFTCFMMWPNSIMPLTGVFDPDMKYFGDTWTGVCDNGGYYCRHPRKHFYKILGKELSSADNPLMVRLMSRSVLVLGLNSLDIQVR